MRRSITISVGLIPVAGRPRAAPPPDHGSPRHPLRAAAVILLVVTLFSTVGAQLVRLASKGSGVADVAMSTPIVSGYARPDLVDRNGRLLASDVEMPSLYADPTLIVDRDEAVEKLRAVLPDIDDAALRSTLAERSRRFVWIKRGLSPTTAQRIHNLGIPGLAFRQELRRAYPSGRLAGHVLGGVDVDNRAVAGIERYLDEHGLVDPVVAARPSTRPPVPLSLDMRVQHALEQELHEASATYKADGASGLVLDVATGEVIAMASLPFADPAHPDAAVASGHVDRVAGGSYELGSIFKLLTIAMAIEGGKVGPDTIVDVSKPLTAGRFEFKDHHPGAAAMSVSDVFIKSSNVGAGRLAVGEGADRQKAFLAALGITGKLRTEAGPVAEPQLPARWGEAETITISFGHGLAVSPLQFAVAAAALVNGGELIEPTLVRRAPDQRPQRHRVVSPATSDALRRMMRRNVADPGGTGRRAAADGLDVGGKTGTAEIARRGRYDRNAVIASFVGAFPMDEPRYLTLVLLFEPERTKASSGEITASHTAAPVTGRLVSRIAPLLGIEPRRAIGPG